MVSKGVSSRIGKSCTEGPVGMIANQRAFSPAWINPIRWDWPSIAIWANADARHAGNWAADGSAQVCK